MDKTRAKLYSLLGVKADDQLDTEDQEGVDAQVDNFTDALAKKLIEQRDAAK
jgi:hypothetical protein